VFLSGAFEYEHAEAYCKKRRPFIASASSKMSQYRSALPVLIFLAMEKTLRRRPWASFPINGCSTGHIFAGAKAIVRDLPYWELADEISGARFLALGQHAGSGPPAPYCGPEIARTQQSQAGFPRSRNTIRNPR